MRIPQLLCLFFFLPSLVAQSSWVEVEIAPNSAQSAQFEADGFVIEEANLNANKVEAIVPDSDLPRLSKLGYSYRVLRQSQPLKSSMHNGRAIDSRFFTWGEVNQKLLDLNVNYPNIARRQNINSMIGTALTHEGREIYAIVISDNPEIAEDEQNVLFVGNHHAREIATPAHMLDLAEYLCANYGTDPEITSWIQNYQIWIAPTWNPDGLEHVWNVDEWWRKNRRHNGGGVYGVDLNRNYLHDWANCGNYSNSPSSNVYCGPSAGSEPETQTMMAFARNMNFVKVIDVHQYGQEVLYPYACGTIDNEARDSIYAVRDRLASQANYSDRLASAGGEHFEWEYSEIGALSYLLELDTTFHPTWSQSQSEIQRARPAYLQMLREAVPASGHVYDALTGAPLDAELTVGGLVLHEGETRMSRASNAGRWHAWIRNGNYNLVFTAPGYVHSEVNIDVVNGGTTKDVFLQPIADIWLQIQGVANVGNNIRFFLNNAPRYAGNTMTVVMGASGGGPFGGSMSAGSISVPVANDYVVQWCIGNAAQFSASIMANGVAVTPWLNIPASASGMSLHASGVIHDGAGANFFAATPALPFEIK